MSDSPLTYLLCLALLVLGLSLPAVPNRAVLRSPAPAAPVVYTVAAPSPREVYLGSACPDGSVALSALAGGSAGRLYLSGSFPLPDPSSVLSAALARSVPGASVALSIAAAEIDAGGSIAPALVYLLDYAAPGGPPVLAVVVVSRPPSLASAASLAASYARTAGAHSAPAARLPCLTDAEDVARLSPVERCSNRKRCDANACDDVRDLCGDRAAERAALAAAGCTAAGFLGGPPGYAVCVAAMLADLALEVHNCNSDRRRCMNDAEVAFAACVNAVDRGEVLNE